MSICMCSVVGFVCLHVRFCFWVSGCVGFWTCEFWVCEICCLCVLCDALCVLCVAVIDLRLSGLGILQVVSVLICAFSSHGDDVCIFVVCFLLCYEVFAVWFSVFLFSLLCVVL